MSWTQTHILLLRLLSASASYDTATTRNTVSCGHSRVQDALRVHTESEIMPDNRGEETSFIR
jgi:hypothetical protein